MGRRARPAPPPVGRRRAARGRPCRRAQRRSRGCATRRGTTRPRPGRAAARTRRSGARCHATSPTPSRSTPAPRRTPAAAGDRPACEPPGAAWMICSATKPAASPAAAAATARSSTPASSHAGEIRGIRASTRPRTCLHGLAARASREQPPIRQAGAAATVGGIIFDREASHGQRAFGEAVRGGRAVRGRRCVWRGRRGRRDPGGWDDRGAAAGVYPRQLPGRAASRSSWRSSRRWSVSRMAP